MTTSTVTPLGLEGRTACSVPLQDADLGLGNANWSKGLQAMSDWIWSGNLNQSAFPNNLARFFLHIPAIFEHQLQFSTTLIFDEPSFRNGVQVSGFIDRPLRELVINLIGQRRQAWYTMTHHAVLGTLTARKHGISDQAFAAQLVVLTEHPRYQNTFTPLQRALLKFADAFATDPKTWTDEDCQALKDALRDSNKLRYDADGRWMARLETARALRRAAMAAGEGDQALPDMEAVIVSPDLPDDVNERMVNAELVELAFLCLQFVALADVFSSLNIPDESFLSDVMSGVLQPDVIERVNELAARGGDNLPTLVPPRVRLPIDDIVEARIEVEPASLKGTRVPLVSYELDQLQATRDKGLSVGGVQTGVYGWSFGSYFPGGLVYLLMHHPELARFEAPYSLPLLFNEDEWRNGTQTGGFVTRRLKEIVYLRVYTTTRARYGLEHHTLFLFNIYLDEYGVGRPPNPPLDDEQRKSARELALKHAENVVLYIQDPAAAPRGTYTDLEIATIEWVERIVTSPHSAHQVEKRLREELEADNRREVDAGLRLLDLSPGIGIEAAHRRLVNHQIAELAMVTAHMDGLGRAMTMLRLESEEEVKTAEGYMTNRPGLFQIYRFVGVSEKAQTANELRLNPQLLSAFLTAGKKKMKISGQEAARTGEF